MNIPKIFPNKKSFDMFILECAISDRVTYIDCMKGDPWVELPEETKEIINETREEINCMKARLNKLKAVK